LDALPNGRLVLQSHDAVGERNAQIFGRDGRLRGSFVMGSAIEFMMADRQNNLWSAYFDEGVYVDPISAAGLARWDSGGNRLWAYSAPQGVLNCCHLAVCECVLVSVSECGRLWSGWVGGFPAVANVGLLVECVTFAGGVRWPV
jgi:hypothetical protein